MVLFRKFDPEVHHRRSIRLRGYDYSKPGFYFFTICSKHREPLFGRIENNSMILSQFGKIVQSTWLDLPNHNNYIILDFFVIMPDHVHGIIQIEAGAGSKPAPASHNKLAPASHNKPAPAYHNKLAPNLGEIIRQLKTFSARKINELRKTTGVVVWQRNYYETVIKGEKELNAIRNYIQTNPTR
ncbi:MAG: transposase [Bacteroidetes bacterium]|nr:transposase [Bacteroidota bacterium]